MVFVIEDLSAPFRAGNRVTPAGDEGGIDVFEQNLGAKARR
jgi:hypothetical protein